MEIADLSARDISGLTWRKSITSFPDGQQCVEVAELGVGAHSAARLYQPTRPDLRCTASEWAALADRIRGGEL